MQELALAGRFHYSRRNFGSRPTQAPQRCGCGRRLLLKPAVRVAQISRSDFLPHTSRRSARSSALQKKLQTLHVVEAHRFLDECVRYGDRAIDMNRKSKTIAVLGWCETLLDLENFLAIEIP